jgi:hypothetical protein
VLQIVLFVHMGCEGAVGVGVVWRPSRWISCIRSDDDYSDMRCSAHLPSPGSRSGGWWVWLEVGSRWGKPLTDGGIHDVDDAAGAVLLLEGDIEVVSPSPFPLNLSISGENPKLRFVRLWCSGAIPSL